MSKARTNIEPAHWKFEEHQRDAVSKGELCPKCLGGDVKCTGSAPDGMSMNYGFSCNTCKEVWEGY